MLQVLRVRANGSTRPSFKAVLAGGAALCAVIASAAAQDATWTLNPGSSNWNTGANWSGGTVPTGTATFGASNTTTLTFSATTTTLQAIQFTGAAPSYTFQSGGAVTKALVLTGSGFSDLSGQLQTLGTGVELHNAATAGSTAIEVLQGSGIGGGVNNAGTLKFFDTATAGSAAIRTGFTGDGRIVLLEFHDSSTAGSATITNTTSAATAFYDNSTAGNATITNLAGSTYAHISGLIFYGSSSAGNATIYSSATAQGGSVAFLDTSTAANATIHGGANFGGNSSSANATLVVDSGWGSLFASGSHVTGTPRLVFSSNGSVDFSAVTSSQVGSIEGTGVIKLGASDVTVGGNNLSTTFNGTVCGFDLSTCPSFQPIAGAPKFTKIGTGTLTYNGRLATSGGATISAGGFVVGDAAHPTARVENDIVVGASGTLSGTGTVTGAVTNDQGGVVAPGTTVGTLTVNSYTQGAGSTLGINVDSTGASQLAVTGNATLDGILQLAFASGYAPALSQQDYTILSASAITGQFASVSATGVGDFTYGINYFPTYVQLSVVSNGAMIDAAFAANPDTYITAPAGMTLVGVMDIVSPRPISMGGPLTINTVTHTIGFSGIVSGSGPLIVAGNGTLILSAANTYTGGTTVNGGATLQIGAGGTTGSILGNVTDNGTLAFNRSDTSTFAGIVSGSGQLIQSGTGTTILTGANTFTGGTTIWSGTLQLGNGGTGGSILGNVTDNGTLAFNRSDTVTFANAISGSGGLHQMGPGTLILNGVNSLSGTSTVTGGTLLVGDAAHPGASLAGGVTVSSGGTLGGYGTIGGAVNNGGTVSPGASIGTLTVASYTQSSAGTLAIEMTPTSSDLLNVTGAASLNGTLAVSLAPGSYGTSERTVVQAGTLSGTFSTLTASGGDGLAVGVRYTPTLAKVVVEPTRNAELFGGFHRQTLATAETVNDLLFTHMRTSYCRDSATTGGRPGEPACPELSVWYQGFGSAGTIDASGGRNLNTLAAGVIGGFDYRWDDGTAFGLTASYSLGQLSLEGGTGKISSDNYSIVVTGGTPLLGGRLDVDALYLSMAGDSKRIVTPDGAASLIATSHPKANAVMAAAEYRYPLLISGLDAFARLTYAHTSLDAFSECGAAPFDFALPSQAKDTGFADLGLRYSEIFTLRSGSTVIPEVTAALRGSTAADRGATGSLAEATGASFTAPSPDLGNAALVVGLGVTAENRSGFQFYLRGSGRYRSGEKEGVLSFGSRYTF